MKTYESTDIGNRLIRHGKYLIPLGYFNPFQKRVAAPKSFISLHADSPNLSNNGRGLKGPFLKKTLGVNEELPASTFEVLRQGNSSWHTILPQESTMQNLFILPGGASVGRNCCLITQDGFAVRETAFLGKHGIAGSVQFSALDPRYWKHRRRGNLTARRSVPKPQYLPGNALALNNCSCHNFYHWLTEIAPRIGAVEKIGLRIDHYVIDHQSAFQREVLKTLGIPQSKWVQPHCNLHLVADQMIWVQEPENLLLRWFGRKIKAGLNLNHSKHEAFRRIYVSRAKAKHRKLDSETEIEKILESYGFEIHCFEDLSFLDQVKMASECEVFVSVHGAALAHSMFMPSGSKIIEIYPEGRSNLSLYPKLSRIFGLEHTVVAAECSSHGQRLSLDSNDLKYILNSNLKLRAA